MTKIRHDSNTQIKLDKDDLYEMLIMGYVTIKENESCSYTLLANAEDFEKAYEEYSEEKNNPETELYNITHPDDNNQEKFRIEEEVRVVDSEKSGMIKRISRDKTGSNPFYNVVFNDFTGSGWYKADQLESLPF